MCAQEDNLKVGAQVPQNLPLVGMKSFPFSPLLSTSASKAMALPTSPSSSRIPHEGDTPKAPSPVIEFKGADDQGHNFTSTSELWKGMGSPTNPDDPWYGKSIQYWTKVEPTVNGVLGGMEHIHKDDIAESIEFIKSIKGLAFHRALDCGAGIGRVSKNLLCPLFEVVDLEEPVAHMMETAKKELAGLRVEKFYPEPMQLLVFDGSVKYDLIAIQWSAIYLTDADFAAFLARCRDALSDTGVIFFKENCMGKGTKDFLVDTADSSLTRSDAHYKAIYKAAGVKVIKEKPQTKWPSNLLPVMMYALR
jgi:protein N-terminal methyltransferase